MLNVLCFEFRSERLQTASNQSNKETLHAVQLDLLTEMLDSFSNN